MSTIPNFNAMTTTEIGQWIAANPTNTKGVEKASEALGINLVTDDDVDGVPGGTKGTGNAPTLPPPTGNPDFNGARNVMAHFEELIILFQQMSAENKKLSREQQNDLIQKAVEQLFASADKKMDAAKETLKMAVVCLVVTVVGVALSILAAPLAGVGKGTKTAADALRKITDRLIVHILRKIGTFVMKGLQATFTNPQVVQGIFSGISQSMNSIGQSRSLTFQAHSDEFQAMAQQTQAEGKKADDRVSDFREEMKKMNELLKTLYDAQIKAEEAAARA
ncbi:MAG: hypothetical protein MI749_09785 [Desulfovibrionales bacterium]|nr:hypothetical protein [Desulfovibrionales bacterium]